MGISDPKIEVGDDYKDEGRCWCQIVRGFDCPAPAEYIVENTTNNGYSLMCAGHKESFSTFPGKYKVIPYTKEDSARLAERLEREGVERPC